jgi:hypothetical protein
MDTTKKRSVRYRKHRKGLAKKYGSQCWICGHDGADTIDHVIPLCKGGSNHRANLMLAHRSCNSRRNAHGTSLLNVNRTPTLDDVLSGGVVAMPGDGIAVRLEARCFAAGFAIRKVAVKAARPATRIGGDHA